MGRRSRKRARLSDCQNLSRKRPVTCTNLTFRAVICASSQLRGLGAKRRIPLPKAVGYHKSCLLLRNDQNRQKEREWRRLFMSNIIERSRRVMELTAELADLCGHPVVVMSANSFRANLQRAIPDPRGPQTRKQRRMDRETEMRKAREVGIPEADIYSFMLEHFPELIRNKRSRKPMDEAWIRRCYRNLIGKRPE
jgi:hypothetical protein